MGDTEARRIVVPDITITVEGAPKSGVTFVATTLVIELSKLGYEALLSDDGDKAERDAKLEMLKDNEMKWPVPNKPAPVLLIRSKRKRRT